MIDKKNITGIILAGGKSSRMGLDKGFLSINGSTFITHIIEAIKPLVNDIIIVSNNKDYDEFGYGRVEDIIEDSGPLAGIYSGLYRSKTENNLVLSCDVPLIKTFVLEQLINFNNENFDVVQLQSQDKTMPLIALYKKHCLHKCLELLNNHEKRLRIAVAQLNTKTISIDSKWNQYVKNINTTSQFNELKHELEH
jgi:molybdenum cofactor guanylyltransferase